MSLVSVGEAQYLGCSEYAVVIVVVAAALVLLWPVGGTRICQRQDHSPCTRSLWWRMICWFFSEGLRKPLEQISQR